MFTIRCTTYSLLDTIKKSWWRRCTTLGERVKSKSRIGSVWRTYNGPVCVLGSTVTAITVTIDRMTASSIIITNCPHERCPLWLWLCLYYSSCYHVTCVRITAVHVSFEVVTDFNYSEIGRGDYIYFKNTHRVDNLLEILKLFYYTLIYTFGYN